MNTDIKTITINGVEYVEKSQSANSVVVDNYSIVRTYSAGAHAGEVIKKEGDEITLKNARRLWRWAGAASLSQLAMEGVSKPKQCKFPREVTQITLKQWIEIIPCTKKAMESIKGVSIWTA